MQIEEKCKKIIGSTIKYKDAVGNTVTRKVIDIKKLNNLFLQVFTEVDSFKMPVKEIEDIANKRAS